MTYYLGTLGALTALPDPEVGLSMPVDRIGGSHQLLSGAKVRDTIGYSRSWQLSWTAITNAQYGLLEGFHYGFTGGGPYYFVDDEQTNLLPLNVSTGTDTTKDTTGFSALNGASITTSPNANGNWNSIGGPFPANGTQTTQVAVPTSILANRIVVQATQNVPGVVSGVTYTFSAYVNNPSSATFSVFPRIQWLSSTGTGTGSNDGAGTAPNTNARVSITASAPAGTAQAQVALLVNATNTSGSTQFVYTDGWQFELNGSASTWQPGVPMPLVTVESLQRSTPLAGICDAQMTLVQVG